MTRLVDRVVAREVLGGVSFLVGALGAKWVEKRLRKRIDAPMSRRAGPLPDPDLVVQRFEGHPVVAAMMAQVLSARVAAEMGTPFVPYSSQIAWLDHAGNCLRQAGFPDEHRLRRRLRDPNDAPAVIHEGFIASGFNRLGARIDHVTEGPEFYVEADPRVAVECKSKFPARAVSADESFARRLNTGIAEHLFQRGVPAHVQVDAHEEPAVADVQAVLDRVETMLKLGVSQAEACGARYTVTIQLLPKGQLIDVADLPERKGSSVLVWRGGPPVAGSPGIDPISVSCVGVDRTKERVESIRLSLRDARHNIPRSGPSLVYISLPFGARQRQYEFADSVVPAIEAELAAGLRRVNKVILVAVSREDFDIANAGLFVDSWTVEQRESRTPLPEGFPVVDHQVLGTQMSDSLRAVADKHGWEHGTLAPDEARASGIYVPAPRDAHAAAIRR